MPSNDERLEVAAKLRGVAMRYEKGADADKSSMWWEISKAVFGVDMQFEDGELIGAIADLIEPEERTCRMTKKGPEYILAGWWECSECGPVYPPCSDEIAIWALQQCPRCGAKVLGGDE